MSRMTVNKAIFEELEKAKEKTTEYGAVGFLYKNDTLGATETVTAIKAFLNPEGYELELTPEENAIATYKSLDSNCVEDASFKNAMQWMDKNFALGLNFHLIDLKEDDSFW